MYEVSVYAITPNLWRWEIRCDGALLRWGTAATSTMAWRVVQPRQRVAAEIDVNDFVNA